jgi:biopolymer transport protein ExbB/TolQ
MSLTQLLVDIACLGTEWVLWLLLGLSILSCQVILDRACFFWKRRANADWLAKQMYSLLRQGELAKARAIVNRSGAPECLVLAAGLSDLEHGPQVVAEAMKAAQARERLRMEGEMGLLTMIATYAPVVGLMGTVLGAVGAIHNMSYPFSEQNLVEAATAGLSEALMSSAAGLFVAVFAGGGYHLLARRIQSVTAQINALMHLVLAEARILELLAAEARPAAALAAEPQPAAEQLELSRAA